MSVGKLPLAPGMHCGCPALPGRTAASHLAANAGNPVPGQPAVAASAGTPVTAPVPTAISAPLKVSDIRPQGSKNKLGPLAFHLPFPGKESLPPGLKPVDLELPFLQSHGWAVGKSAKGNQFIDQTGAGFDIELYPLRVMNKTHPRYMDDVGFVLSFKYGSVTAKHLILPDGTVAKSWTNANGGRLPGLPEFAAELVSLSTATPLGTAIAKTYLTASPSTPGGITRSTNLTPDWDAGIVVDQKLTGPLTPPINFDEVIVRSRIDPYVGGGEYTLYHPVYGEIARVVDVVNFSVPGAKVLPGKGFKVFDGAWRTANGSDQFVSLADALTAIVEWHNKYGFADRSAGLQTVPLYYPSDPTIAYDPTNPVRGITDKASAVKRGAAPAPKIAPAPAAAPATPPPPPPPPPPPVTAPPPPPPSLSPMTRPIMAPAATILGKKTGAAAGSNTAGKSGFWTGTDGVKRYVKEYATSEQAITEVLSFRIYELLGVPVPEAVLTVDPTSGKTLIATTIVDNTGVARATSQKAARDILAGNAYAADMLLANYDVMGAGGNVVIGKDGRVYRIDAGGTLEYRAQGALKSGPLDNVKRTFLSMLVRNTAYGDLLIKTGLGLADRNADPSTFQGLAAQVTAIRDLLLPNGATSVLPLIDGLLAGLDPAVLGSTPPAIYAKHLADFLDPRLTSLLRYAKVPKGGTVATATTAGPSTPAVSPNAPQTTAQTPVVAPPSGARSIATPINGDRIRQKLISLSSGWTLTHPDGGKIGVLLGPNITGVKDTWKIQIDGGPEFTSTSVYTVRSLAAKWINANGVVDVPAGSTTATTTPTPPKPEAKVAKVAPIPKGLTVDTIRHKVGDARDGGLIEVGTGTFVSENGKAGGMTVNAMAQGSIRLSDRDGNQIADVLFATSGGRRHFKIKWLDGTTKTFSLALPDSPTPVPKTDAEIRAVKKAVFEELKTLGGIPRDKAQIDYETNLAGKGTHKAVPARARTADDPKIPPAPKPLGDTWLSKRARTASPRRNGGTVVPKSVATRNQKPLVVKGDPKAKHPHRRQVHAEIPADGAPTTAVAMDGTILKGKALPKVEIPDTGYAQTLAEDVVILDGASAGPKVADTKGANTASARLRARWQIARKELEALGKPQRNGTRGARMELHDGTPSSLRAWDAPNAEEAVVAFDERLALEDKLRLAKTALYKLAESIGSGYRVSTTELYGDKKAKLGRNADASEVTSITSAREKITAKLAATDPASPEATKLRVLLDHLTMMEKFAASVDYTTLRAEEKAYYDAYLEAITRYEAKLRERQAKIDSGEVKKYSNDKDLEEISFALPTVDLLKTSAARFEADRARSIAPTLEIYGAESYLEGLFDRRDGANDPWHADKVIDPASTREGDLGIGGASVAVSHIAISEVLTKIFSETGRIDRSADGMLVKERDYSGWSNERPVVPSPTWVRKARADALREYADARFAPGSPIHAELHRLADKVETSLRLDLKKDLALDNFVVRRDTTPETPSVLFEGGTVLDDLAVERLINLTRPMRRTQHSEEGLTALGMTPEDTYNLPDAGNIRVVGRSKNGKLVTYDMLESSIVERRAGSMDVIAMEVVRQLIYADDAVQAIRVTSETDVATLTEWGFSRGEGVHSDLMYLTSSRAKTITTEAFGSLTGGTKGAASGIAGAMTKKKAEPKVVSTRFRPAKPVVEVTTTGVSFPAGISLHDLVRIMRDQTSGFSASLADGGKIASPAISELWTLLGLMDPPTVVPAEGFADLIGDGTVVHVRGDKRGIYRDQLLGYPIDPKAGAGNGSERFSGSGVFGDGQYAQAIKIGTDSRLVQDAISKAWSVTKGYSGGTKDYGRTGPRTLYLISENVKAITTSGLKTKAGTVVAKLNQLTGPDAADARELARVLERLSNNDNGLGLLALMLGYDVLIAPGNDYSILLNPTAAIYLEDSVGTQEGPNDDYGTVSKKSDEMRSWTLGLLTSWHRAKNTKAKESEAP